MASRRFRRLERDPNAAGAAGEESAAGDVTPDVAGRARSLERDGALVLDAAPLDTDFCRHCRFENRAGVQRCLNCGTPLGGSDQEAFDEEMRARRAAEREAQAAQGAPAPETNAATAAPDPLAAVDVEQLLRAAERDEPGFGTVLAAGVLASCIFALVSIPLRRIFGGAGGAGGAFELVLLVAITAGLYGSVRRKLRRL